VTLIPKLDVAGSNPVSRSIFSMTCTNPFHPVLRLCSIQNRYGLNHWNCIASSAHTVLRLALVIRLRQIDQNTSTCRRFPANECQRVF